MTTILTFVRIIVKTRPGSGRTAEPARARRG